MRAQTLQQVPAPVDGASEAVAEPVQMRAGGGGAAAEAEAEKESAARPTSTLVYPPGTADGSQPGADIVRQYPFSSALHRMSVIVRDRLSKQHLCFAKGSPEMALALARRDTSAPFATASHLYSHNLSLHRVRVRVHCTRIAMVWCVRVRRAQYR